MFKVIFILLSMLTVLSACEEVSNAREASHDKIYEWIHGQQRPQPEPRIIESRYCYKVQADVLCYDSPQLNKEDQFIGEQ